MGVRRHTTNRLTLVRSCGTCGTSFLTTADTPWVRQIPRDGKKQSTTYFCSEKCFASSYKHIGFFDGKAEQRRKEREAKRDIKEKNRLYYERHAERDRSRARARYWADPESARADNQYQRAKRKALQLSTN